MVLILSIFKNALLIFLIAACSSSTKDDRSATNPVPAVVREPIIAGPTQTANPLFVDKTIEYGLENVRATHFYAVDLNNDSHTDLVVLPEHYSVPEFYYFNPQAKKFELYSGESLPTGLRASFLAIYDFDGDGVLDMIVATLNQRTDLTPAPLLAFKGELKDGRVHFKQIEKAFDERTRPVAALGIFDFNLDGKLDLFEANWFDLTALGRPAIHDRLLLGDGLSFSDQTQRLMGEAEFNRSLDSFVNAAPSFGVSLCDVDKNGYPDILVTTSSGHENKMWMNLAFESYEGRVFRDYGAESGFAQDDMGKLDALGAGHSFFAACTDYNNDGLMDIMIGELTHPYEPEMRDRSSFLTGSSLQFPPKFIRTPYQHDQTQSRTQSDRRGVFADLNHDGLIDVLVDNSGFPPETRLIAFMQNEDHSYEDQAPQLGIDIVNPQGTIVLDINQDGRMDILTAQTNVRESQITPRIYLFENQIPFDSKRSLRFHLKGDRANIHGLGAQLLLETDQSKQTRFVSYQEGAQASQNEMGVYFGLGRGQVKKLEVTWPILDKKGKPLVRHYDLSRFKFQQSLEITLCENGTMGVGRRYKCPTSTQGQ